MGLAVLLNSFPLDRDLTLLAMLVAAILWACSIRLKLE